MNTKPVDSSNPLGYRLIENEVCFKYCPPTITPAGELCDDRAGLKQFLLGTIGGKLVDPAISYFIDNRYYLPTEGEVRAALFSSVVGKLAAIDNRFDCDDYAFGVKGEMALFAYRGDLLDYALCFGVVVGVFDWQTGGHAACFFVSRDRNIFFVEPHLPDTIKDPSDIALFTLDSVRQISFILI